MATTRGGDDPEAQTRVERVEEVARNIVAGHPQGAIRRIVLYGVVVLCLALDGTFGVILGGIGLIAVLLLVATDTL